MFLVLVTTYCGRQLNDSIDFKIWIPSRLKYLSTSGEDCRTILRICYDVDGIEGVSDSDLQFHREAVLSRAEMPFSKRRVSGCNAILLVRIRSGDSNISLTLFTLHTPQTHFGEQVIPLPEYSSQRSHAVDVCNGVMVKTTEPFTANCH